MGRTSEGWVLWLVPGLENPFTLRHTFSRLAGLKSCADSQGLVLRVRLRPPSRRMLLCLELSPISGFP